MTSSEPVDYTAAPAGAGLVIRQDPFVTIHPPPALTLEQSRQLTEPSHPTPEFVCPDRVSQGRSRGAMAQDGWARLPNGDHVCSWCGSMSPNGIFEAVRAAADPANDTRIEPSTKHYKFYIRRASVPNASVGAIKFYSWHLPPENSPLDIRLSEHWQAAMEASARKSELVFQRFVAG